MNLVLSGEYNFYFLLSNSNWILISWLLNKISYSTASTSFVKDRIIWNGERKAFSLAFGKYRLVRIVCKTRSKNKILKTFL